MDEELSSLKASVNLVEYAAAQGYWVDKAKSSRRSTVMRHDNGDKIVISYGSKCWMYFSSRDTADNGTIIDFIQNRQGINLGRIKSRLRDWLGRPQPVRIETKYKNLQTGKKDPQAVQRYIQGTRPISDTSYLQSRHIGDDTIYGKRFGGTIRQDRRGNTVFLHRNLEGYCGAELKNKNFTGCPKDSVKGIWHSRMQRGDRRLVICESGIDNLSYHILHGTEHDLHVSLAGNFSPEQKELVNRVIQKMPAASTIVAAFDNDAEGRKYSQIIKTMVPEDKIFERHTPKTNDWNADLKGRNESREQPALTHRPSMMRV